MGALDTFDATDATTHSEAPAISAVAPAVAALPVYEAIPHPRLHEGVVQLLVQQIAGGVFPPGAMLPTEPELAQRFGVSRTVIREAVRILVSKGLIAVKQGSGMWVEHTDRWDHLDPLVIFEQVRTGRDAALLDELIEMRRVLEMEIASLAAQRRTDDDLASLRSALEGMAGATRREAGGTGERTDSAAYTTHDVLFHDALLIAARNRLLREALRPVSNVLHAGRFLAALQDGVVERSLGSHASIYHAIHSGDPESARETMRRHIVEFETDIRTGLYVRTSS